MKVEIKGGTVALLSLDDTSHPAARYARLALALVQPAPTPEQHLAWNALSQMDRCLARDACTANVPAVLVIEDGKWSVRSGS